MGESNHRKMQNTPQEAVQKPVVGLLFLESDTDI